MSIEYYYRQKGCRLTGAGKGSMSTGTLTIHTLFLFVDLLVNGEVASLQDIL